VSLYIVGKHELVGLEELVDNSVSRQVSAVCHSTQMQCYWLSKNHFIDHINQYKISDHVLQEQVLKHHHYLKRMD
jgi:hypothetical protein